MNEMSEVGYEGHIWEELFGKISFKKVALYLFAIILIVGIAIAYLVLK